MCGHIVQEEIVEKSLELEACPICGGAMLSVNEEHEVRIGRRAVVLESDHLKCQDCGETFFNPEQLDEVQRRASETVRQEEKLLFPWEVRRIRENLGMSQSQFEKLLGVGPKTVLRWEKGTVFQNCATDSLLRVLRGVPAAVDFLANRNGVFLGTDRAFLAAPIQQAAQQRYHYTAKPVQEKVIPIERAMSVEHQVHLKRSRPGAVYKEAIG